MSARLWFPECAMISFPPPASEPNFHLGNMPEFNAITEKLLVGTCPKNGPDIEQLKANGVDHVICLQSDHDFIANNIDWVQMEADYKTRKIQVTRIAMIDFDENNIAGRLAKAAAVVSDAMKTSSRIYLHCTAGRERSPTVAAAWLMLDQGLSAEDACEKMTTARPSNPYLFMLQKFEHAQ